MYQLTVRAAATSAPHNTGTRRARSPRGYIYQPVSPTRRALSRFLDRIIQGLRVWLASMAGHGAHNSRTQVDTIFRVRHISKIHEMRYLSTMRVMTTMAKAVRASRHARCMNVCMRLAYDSYSHSAHASSLCVHTGTWKSTRNQEYLSLFEKQ